MFFYSVAISFLFLNWLWLLWDELLLLLMTDGGLFDPLIVAWGENGEERIDQFSGFDLVFDEEATQFSKPLPFSPDSKSCQCGIPLGLCEEGRCARDPLGGVVERVDQHRPELVAGGAQGASHRAHLRPVAGDHDK